MIKRTFVWEANNPPPTNYLWVKSDGKVYEYNTKKREWVLSNVFDTGLDKFATKSDVQKLINQIDLTDYVTVEEAEEALAEKQDKILDLNEIRSNAQAHVAGYQKPETGIPETDLSNSVRNALNKANSALQSFTETDPTIPAWAKSKNKPIYTAQEVGALPSDTFIPTSLSDLGVSFKTINNQSLLGSGNIEIQGSDGSDPNTVKFTQQLLTPEQQTQVRTNIGAASQDALDDKVDKETGKGLSTNDFTNADKEAVEQSLPLGVQTALDRTQDMDTVRSGAAAGATAYQKPPTGIPVSDLASGVIPTALSDLSEDATHRTVTDEEKTLWNETNIIHASVISFPMPFTGYTYEQMLAAFGITQDDYSRLAGRGGVYSTLMGGYTFVVLGASSGSMLGPVFITGVQGTEIRYRKVEFQNLLNTYSFSSEIVIKGFSGSYNDLTNKPKEIYVAEYGDTGYNEVTDALTAGKLVFAKVTEGGILLYLPLTGRIQYGNDAYSYMFELARVDGSAGSQGICAELTNTDAWEEIQYFSDPQADWNQSNSSAPSFIKNKPDLSKFVTKSVDDLVNYYLKSETYTKTEVQNLIAAINQFHYEIYASTSAIVSPATNVLYLIGPTGTGADKYEEYVYSNNAFVKIGDTSIYLSNYVTTSALNTALADYTTTANLTTLLAGKQDTISDLATIRTGAAAGATAYQKPSTGIPASDLATGVIPEPTKPDWNASENSIEGILNKPDLTLKEDTSNKVTSLDSTATNIQYPAAKATYDAIHPAIQTQIDSNGMQPNVLYNLGTITNDITFDLDTVHIDSNIANYYNFTFNTSSVVPNVSWDSSITSWVGNCLNSSNIPELEPSSYYEVSILNGKGVIVKF